MDPVLSAVLLSWDWRLDVSAVLLLMGSLYSLGWWRIRRQATGQQRLATGRRLVTYLIGLLMVAIALMSPVDVLSGQLFFMHMIQHKLLIVFAPALLWMANPLPFYLWGLPPRLRRRAGGLLSPASPFRRTLRAVTAPGLVWLTFVAILVGWHDPNAYDAALRSRLVHDIEHLTFFGSAMLFWWQVVGAGPRLHTMSRGMRLAYVLGVVPVNMAIGVTIAFASQPIYTYYTAMPRLWGISVMLDQMISGVIMWIPGSEMYIYAALVLIARMVQSEAEKAPLPEGEFATDAALRAPGWEAAAEDESSGYQTQAC
jgi:cytochrome c oxidase assembly factor CtaG